VALYGIYCVRKLALFDVKTSLMGAGVAAGVLLMLLMTFVGAISAYPVGMAVLRWNVNRKMRHLKQKGEFTGPHVHEITLAGSTLCVTTEGARPRKELRALRILKYSDMIVVLGFGVPLPVPRTADFGDGSFQQFYDMLIRHRRTTSFLTRGRAADSNPSDHENAKLRNQPTDLTATPSSSSATT
jgi:hypothetical protein